jgi:hypothetical protein
MSFFEWMTISGIVIIIIDVATVNSKLDRMEKDREKINQLRSDVDGLMSQAWKIEDGR